MLNAVMIFKHRARKPIARGTLTNYGVHPYGVGGLDNNKCYSFRIGTESGFTLFVTKSQWDEMHNHINELEKELT